MPRHPHPTDGGAVVTWPYTIAAGLALWFIAGILVALGWSAVRSVLSDGVVEEPTDSIEAHLAITWRRLRACDAVDEALAEWSRTALEADDLAVAHNIAVARGMVGLLRDRTEGL
jgi:hypothetical protein